MLRTRSLALVTLALLLGSGVAQADTEAAIQAAIESNIRTEPERARDANRKPAETLAFFGLEEDMRVLELLPGGGWYTKILAPVLEEQGQLYVAIGTQRVQGLVDDGVISGVEVIETEGTFTRPEGTRRFFFDGFAMDLEDLDMALTFRNLHNMTPRGRKDLNDAVFAALKPGGLYGVVDHTRRHMQVDNVENWRRMDPVLMIKEIEASGFEFVDFSDLHYRPDDTLEYEVGRRSVTGNTDRFTLLFRKPE